MADSRANPEILKLLNEVLTGELTAINQYFAHAKMCANWGLEGLARTIRNESIEEMKHAEELMDRILYLDGHPNVQRLGKVNVGEHVREQLELDLQLENEALPRLSEGIETCWKAGDHGSRELLERIHADEEAHVDWIETQLELIDTLGLDNYLSRQLDGSA